MLLTQLFSQKKKIASAENAAKKSTVNEVKKSRDNADKKVENVKNPEPPGKLMATKVT